MRLKTLYAIERKHRKQQVKKDKSTMYETIKAMLERLNYNIENHFYDQNLDYKLETLRKENITEFNKAYQWAIDNQDLKNII